MVFERNLVQRIYSAQRSYFVSGNKRIVAVNAIKLRKIHTCRVDIAARIHPTGQLRNVHVKRKQLNLPGFQNLAGLPLKLTKLFHARSLT